VAGEWTIREGQRGDLPRMERLWRFLYAHHTEVSTATVPFVSADERWPARLREFRQSLDDEAGVFLVADDGGQPVGFAFSTMRAPSPIFAGGPVGELEVLVVAPERRGEGIGEELTRSSLDGLRELGATTLRVVVVAGNESALGFYRRLGIEPALNELLAPLEADEGPGETP
jgi:ribosomal protein S18 acetylase RimI-like enzyme